MPQWTYLQPHYSNGVFCSVYLLALDKTKRLTLPAPHCRNGSCRYVGTMRGKLEIYQCVKNLVILYLKETIKLVWTWIHNNFSHIVRYHRKVQWSEILVRFFTHSGLNLSELYCKNQAWTLLHLEIPRSRNHSFLLKLIQCSVRNVYSIVPNRKWENS